VGLAARRRVVTAGREGLESRPVAGVVLGGPVPPSTGARFAKPVVSSRSSGRQAKVGSALIRASATTKSFAWA
jgi:hypothetical protein